MCDPTITASPLSYSKVCDTFRPRIGQRAAIRTDLGGKAFVTVRDFSFGQGARVKNAKGLAGEAKCVAFALKIASFQRHPSQRLFATIAQVGPVVLRARTQKLLAHIVDRARMQPEFLAASGRQVDQVKVGEPRPGKTQGILLLVVAIIPDEVDRARLPVKQPGQRFNTIAERRFHSSLTAMDDARSIFNARASTASQSVPFTPRPEGRGFSGQI